MYYTYAGMCSGIAAATSCYSSTLQPTYTVDLQHDTRAHVVLRAYCTHTVHVCVTPGTYPPLKTCHSSFLPHHSPLPTTLPTSCLRLFVSLYSSPARRAAKSRSLLTPATSPSNPTTSSLAITSDLCNSWHRIRICSTSACASLPFPRIYPSSRSFSSRRVAFASRSRATSVRRPARAGTTKAASRGLGFARELSSCV